MFSVTENRKQTTKCSNRFSSDFILWWNYLFSQTTWHVNNVLLKITLQ